MSSTRNGAAAVMETMAAHGIDTVFGIPGTHNLELYRHLQRLGLRHVTPRHEQGAGYAADAFARVSGRPAAVLTTSGPGLTNAMTAAATSYADSVPALYVSPGVPLGTEGRDLGLLHEAKDSSGAMDRLVRWSRRVRSVDEASQAVAEAMTSLTRVGRRRPVHVEIPLDVLEAPWDGEPAAPSHRPDRSIASEQLDAAASLLRSATRTVVVAGGGSVDAADQLRAVVARLDAPVVTTSAGKGVVAEDDPRSVGAAIRLRAAQDAIAGADAVLVVGSELGDSDLWGGLIEARAMVRIDVEVGQLSKNCSVLGEFVGVEADAGPALTGLLQRLGDGDRIGGRSARQGAPSGSGSTSGAAWAAQLRAACLDEAAVDAGVNRDLAAAVAEALPPGAVVTGDSSQITYYGAMHYLLLREPRRFCYMPGYATLGYALPAAIGAAVARPGSPAVALVGDGAFMFTLPELMTAVELQLPVVTVLVDNGGYREIRNGMEQLGVPPIAVDLARPDFTALARSFGASAHRVADADELARRLPQCLEAGGPAVLVVDLA